MCENSQLIINPIKNRKMKQTSLLTIVAACFLVSSCGGGQQANENSSKRVEITVARESYKPAEKEALIVLKAYVDEDLETLKTFASGASKMVLDDKYFAENDNVASFREKIMNNWQGSFTDIRYYEDEVNFQKYYYAIAAFYESPTGQITGVGLKSEDGENWKMAAFGTKYIKKDEFEAYSTEMPE